MVYRIDNRPKKHRGRYTIFGIILGLALAFGGLYVYDNHKDVINGNVDSIKQFAIKQIPKDSPIIQVTQGYTTKPEIVSVQQPIKQEQVITYSLNDLQQTALDDINNYRTQSGLQPLIIQNAKASQVWANHLLSEGCIAHREGNSGPMKRYMDNGDQLQMVFENVSGGYGSNTMTPIEAIKQADSEMMNNDAEQGNAHRNNILNPNHQSVSLGIAYNSDKMIIVQDFQEPLIGNWQGFDMSYSDQKDCW